MDVGGGELKISIVKPSVDNCSQQCTRVWLEICTRKNIGPIVLVKLKNSTLLCTKYPYLE